MSNAGQKIKSFFKKFWHFVLIGVLSAAVIVMIIVMCVCMTLKGKKGGKEEDKGGQLETPKNVQVVADRVLVWDDVENAGGYTVKINDDETTTAEKNFLDLTADSLKTFIVKGENTLSVKANAQGKYTASAYSEPITYELVLTPAEEAAAYVRLVEEIETVTANSEYSVALTVQEKIDEAAAYYKDMSLEARALENVTAAKSSFDTKEGAYTSAMSTAQTAYTEFLPSLTAATNEITKEESLDALETAKAAAKEAYDTMGTLAQGMLTDDESAAYDSLATTVTAWKEEIATAKTALTYTFPGITDDDKQAEANIVKAEELLDTYKAYKAYVQAGVDTEHTAITTAKTAAENQIKGTVDALKEEVGKVDTTTEISKEYLKKLRDVQEKIDALGAYASTLWKAEGNTNQTKISDAIKTVLTTPYGTAKDGLFVDGATSGNVTIIYEAYNVEGDAIALGSDNIPELTVSINGTSVDATFTKNANNKYTFTTAWAASAEEGKLLTVAYKIGDGAEKSVPYSGLDGEKFTDANMWFNPSNDYLAIKDGKFSFTSGDAFVDIYRASELTINSDNSLTVTGLPIVTGVSVKDGVTTEEDLRYYLSNIDKGRLIGLSENVRFVIYKTANGEAGDQRTTLFNHERVSHGAYPLVLTADDAKVRINFTDVGMGVNEDGSITMGSAYDRVEAQLTELGATHSDLEWIITATVGEKSGTFTLDYDGNFTGNVMISNIFKAIGPVGNVEISLEFRLAPKADSKLNETHKISNPVTFMKTLNVSLPGNALQAEFKSHGYFEFVRAGGNGAVFNFGVKAVEVKVEKGDVSYSVFLIPNYDEKSEDTYALYMYENENGTGEVTSANKLNDGNIELGNFNNFIKSIYGKDDEGFVFDVKDGWKVSTRVIYNGDYGVESEYSETTTWTFS